MMKSILIVCSNPPWTGGGIQKIIREVCKRLKNKYKFRIYCTSNGKNKSGEFKWEGISVRIFSSARDGLSWSLFKALRNEKQASLIHAHNYGTFIPFITTSAVNNIPVIINPHFHPANGMVRSFFDITIGSKGMQKAELLIFNSNAERDLLFRRFQKLQNNQSVVIYNGCPLFQIKQSQPFSFETKIILNVSRLVRYKNLHVILQSLKYLPEYIAVIIGSGPDADNLKKLAARLEIIDRVKFLGNLTDQEIYRWYRSATVFVQPSGIESFGLTCIEALAAGVPVVANDDGGGLRETIDLLKPNVLKIDVKNNTPAEIAQVIVNASTIHVNIDLTIFDWDYISTQFSDLYTIYAI